MLQIHFPEPDFKIKITDGKEQIFDAVRKRFVRLTNEEWVRQNFIQYLIQVKKYPASLISVEKEIKFNELKKRCDIVVYKRAKPCLIVECKEMNVVLNEQTLEQILIYNSQIAAQYLVITNGKENFGWEITGNHFHPLNELPDF